MKLKILLIKSAVVLCFLYLTFALLFSLLVIQDAPGAAFETIKFLSKKVLNFLLLNLDAGLNKPDDAVNIVFVCIIRLFEFKCYKDNTTIWDSGSKGLL